MVIPVIFFHKFCWFLDKRIWEIFPDVCFFSLDSTGLLEFFFPFLDNAIYLKKNSLNLQLCHTVQLMNTQRVYVHMPIKQSPPANSSCALTTSVELASSQLGHVLYWLCPWWRALGLLCSRSQGRCSTQIKHSYWCKSWNQPQGH
jgi:hypothetical protein